MSGGHRQKERQKYHHGIDTTDKIELGARNIYRLNAAGAFCLEASRDMSIKGRLAHFHFGGDHWIMTNVRMLINTHRQTVRSIRWLVGVAVARNLLLNGPAWRPEKVVCIMK